MKKETAIQKVQESVGSLFTKQDVINLINQIDTETNIDFEELKDRLEQIVVDADQDEIEVNSSRCVYSINNGNEISVDEVYLETDDFRASITHDIGELIEAVERGEACQKEVEESC